MNRLTMRRRTFVGVVVVALIMGCSQPVSSVTARGTENGTTSASIPSTHALPLDHTPDNDTAGYVGEDKPKPKAEPLTEAALLKLAEDKIDEDVIVALIKKRGVSFKVDDAVVRRLKKAGLPDTVLATLNPISSDKAEPTPADEKPIATGKHDAGLAVEILECKPTKNGTLMIRWCYRNPTKEKIEVFAETPTFRGVDSPPNTIEKFWKNSYYIEGNLDSATAYHHYNLIEVDSETKKPTGKRAAKQVGKQAVSIKPGGRYEMWAAFDLPQNKDEKTITLLFMDISPIKNVPIQEKE